MLKTTLRDDRPPRVLNTRTSTARNGPVNETQIIRKTQSMVNWTNATPTPSPVYRGGKENRYPSNNQKVNKAMSSPAGKTLETSKVLKSTETNPLQSNEAENRLFPRKLRHHASFLLPSFKKKTGDSSTNQQIPITEIASNHPFSPRPESRKVSQSSSKKSETLKDKLRRYFRKSSGESVSTTGLPPQHIEATRLHFGNFINIKDSSTADNNAQNASGENGDRLTPSPPAYEALLLVEDGANSQRVCTPVKSEITTESKSRVTSWTDSTIPESVITQENQLSIIAEDDGDITALPTFPSEKRSSSLGSNFFKRLIRSRGPSISHDCNASGGIPPTNQESGQFGSVSTPTTKGSVYQTLQSKRRRGSLLSLTTSWRNKSTVRSVSPETQFEKQLQRQRMDNSSSPPGPNPQVASLVRKLRKKPPPLAIPPATAATAATNPYLEMDRSLSPEPLATPTQLSATHKWSAVALHPVEPHQSLFFPHSPSSVSPGHARALLGRANMGAEGEVTPTMLTPLRKMAADQVMAGALSPSVYSRASGEIDETSHEAGTAGVAKLGESIVLVDTEKENKSPLEQGVGGYHPRENSVEWQSFLASELADLSVTSIGSNAPFSVHGDYLTSTPMRDSRNKGKGHVREMQQIVDNDEDTTLHRLQIPTTTSITQLPSSSPRKASRKLENRNGNSSTTKISPFMHQENSKRSHPLEKENAPPKRGISNGTGDSSLLSLASLMNDRFPMFDTGGPSSRPGSTSSLRAIMAGKSSGDKQIKIEKSGHGDTSNTSTSRQRRPSPLTASQINLLKSSSSAIQHYSTNPSSINRTTPTNTTNEQKASSNSSQPIPVNSTTRELHTPDQTPIVPKSSSSSSVIAPTSQHPPILSPIPRRRQSTLVATLTTASLTSSYHTARQACEPVPTTTTSTATASSLTPSPSSSLLIVQQQQQLQQQSGPRTPQLGGVRSSSSLSPLRMGGGSGSEGSGIRRSGALRAVNPLQRGQLTERGIGGAVMVGSRMGGLRSDEGGVPVVRVEGVEPVKTDSVKGEWSGANHLVKGAVGVDTSGSAFGVEPWRGGLKENSNPVRELVPPRDLSPGKRMAERWLSERRVTLGRNSAGGRREGSSSPMFL
jgi:hypothetical protein